MHKGAEYVMDTNHSHHHNNNQEQPFVNGQCAEAQPSLGEVGMTDLFERITPEDAESIEGYWQQLSQALGHLSASKRKKCHLALRVCFYKMTQH